VEKIYTATGAFFERWIEHMRIAGLPDWRVVGRDHNDRSSAASRFCKS
jgi:hypothetical protein